MEYVVLFGVYLLYLSGIVWRMVVAYRQQALSFYLLFSAIYVVTFYFGFPFSLWLGVGFAQPMLSIEQMSLTLLVSFVGYLCYEIGYGFVVRFYPLSRHSSSRACLVNPQFAKLEGNLTACLLGGLALLSLGGFIYLNDGLLLFKLTKYHQIFSSQVEAIPLKRFFYFFLPALLLVFFLYPSKRMWWYLLILASGYGLLSYLAVGGTRANLALAVFFFVLIGLYKKYLNLAWLVAVVMMVLVGMFILALVRYDLNVQGREAWFTFLYLTRDTFSPWENVVKILHAPIEYQGVMPIIRDFYVYIPQSIWADRPDIVWNSANYFTKVVLGNQSGLAISPTILGSFYIMGGLMWIVFGMMLCGVIICILDRCFAYGKRHQQVSRSAIIQAYCFAQLFNLVVLVREGADAFVSRFVFFNICFMGCWAVAYVISRKYQNE